VIIYSLDYQPEEGYAVYPTLKEAMREAWAISDEHDFPVEIREETVTTNLSGRRLICALLNQRGWSANSRIVCTVLPRKKRGKSS
jgi:hypothetical protein